MGIEREFETGTTPRVMIDQIHGNMQLRAWGESRVVVSSNGKDYYFSQDGDEIQLGNFDDCHISVPLSASVTLGEVHGNANISGVRGQIDAEEIHGNFRGDELGATMVGRVDGDFGVRDVAGTLVVGRVNGNFSAGEVKGSVQLEHCDGNCTVREVEGHVTVARVRGNLSCHDTESLTVDKVSGNLNVNDVNGNVQANKVGGNVSAVELMGDLNVESVGGNLKVRDFVGGLNARVGGSAKLDLKELSIPFISVHAGDDVRCRVPVELDARLALRAGNEIVVRGLPLPNQWNSHQVEYTVGNGEGSLELRAGNRVKLVTADGSESAADWGADVEFQFQGDFNERAADLVQQVAEQVEAQVEAFTRQLNERLAQLDTGDAIAAKVQTKVQSAMRQAEEKIAEAMRRAERQTARQAERQAAREVRHRMRGMPPTPPGVPGVPGAPGFPHVHMPPPPPAPAPKPKRTPPSPEERMMVLKMLEEGKISVEQAEQLLAAMGE
jgi:hypothetical protein